MGIGRGCSVLSSSLVDWWSGVGSIDVDGWICGAKLFLSGQYRPCIPLRTEYVLTHRQRINPGLAVDYKSAILIIKFDLSSVHDSIAETIITVNTSKRIKEKFTPREKCEDIQEKVLASRSTLLLSAGVGGVAFISRAGGRLRWLLGSVCRGHLPGGNRSRSPKLRERARICLSCGSWRRFRLLFIGRSRRRTVGGRGRGSCWLLRWARCNGQVSCRAHCSPSNWRAGSGTTTESIAQQSLETLQFCAKFLQPKFVAFPCALKSFGNGVLQCLDFITDPACFVVSSA